jgi:transposase
MEQDAKTVLVSELCGTCLNVNVWDVCKIVRNYGCCRFKKLKVLAVVRHELECLNEVRCNVVSNNMP